MEPSVLLRQDGGTLWKVRECKAVLVIVISSLKGV